MKLRDFYEFNSQIKGTNDLVKGSIVFLVDKDTMNSLINEFNKNNTRKLKKFEYNGMVVNCYNDAITNYLEELGLSQYKDTVEDVYDTELGDLEVIGIQFDEYNGIEVELKMSEDIFNEYKRYFMYTETHDEDDFEDQKMYSIVLETEEFIEKQCSDNSLDMAKRMFTFLENNVDENGFRLFLVEHTEDEDPTDLIEEGKGILDVYTEMPSSVEDAIIDGIKESFKPLGMRGKLYNLYDVDVVSDTELCCIVQSRLNPELYVNFYSGIMRQGNEITFKANEEHRMYRISHGKQLDMFTAKDLEIFTDMLKYTKDMVEGTVIEV